MIRIHTQYIILISQMCFCAHFPELIFYSLFLFFVQEDVHSLPILLGLICLGLHAFQCLNTMISD
jgi:hypothetical protein